MKKKNNFRYLFLAGALLFSSLTMLGCENGKSNSDNTNKEQEQEEPAKEENNTDTNKPDDKTDNKDKSVTDNKENNGNKDNSNQDNSKVEITYYTYDINSDSVSENKKMVDEISAGNVINALVESSVLPSGTSVNKAKVEEVGGVRTLFVDVNSKFMEFNLGSSGESLMLRCFANSMVKTFKVEQVKLTVDGNNYSSGHFYFEDNDYLKFK